MKKIFLLLLTFPLILSLSAQSNRMKAFVDFHSYCTPEMEPYVEFAFYFDGASLNYVPTKEGKFEAEILINVKVMENDSTIAGNLNYILVSDSYTDTIRATKKDFADIQYLKVKNGNYFVRFSFADLHGGDTLQFEDLLNINYPQNEVCMSELFLLQDVQQPQKNDFFVKYNYAITPLFHGYAPQSVFLLSCISEIYNTEKVFGKGKTFGIKSYIETLDGRMVVFKDSYMEKRMETSEVAIFLNQIPISALPSGNYYLVVSIFNEDTTYYSQKVFFQRSNPHIKLNIEEYTQTGIENTFVANINDTAALVEYVRSLYPIATSLEQEFFVTKMNKVPFDQLQRFFYHFWLTRSPENPAQAWEEYNAKVKYVQETYGNHIIKGYRTDRGRVFLRYGAPNSIWESPFDSHSYPYEIWHYYHLEDQSNVKFIFYNVDLVSNDFELLHSDKFGEVYDAFWQKKLVNRRTMPNYDFDEKGTNDYWGDKTKDDWDFFK